MADLVKLLKQEYCNVKHSLKSKYSDIHGKIENAVMASIRETGFCIIPDYYDKDQCQKIIDEINSGLEKYKEKIWVDPFDSDHRIFGADRVFPEIYKFYNDDFIVRMLQSYEKSDSMAGFTMAARLIYKEQNLGSGQGWHRDSAARKQTKAIIYLNDVDEKNGPFQYLIGSHTSFSIIKGQIADLFRFNQKRFSEEEIEDILRNNQDRLRTIAGKAGTLIFADTRGIHRGKPMENGTRYSLTNYCWFDSPIPPHIEKMLIA